MTPDRTQLHQPDVFKVDADLFKQLSPERVRGLLAAIYKTAR